MHILCVDYGPVAFASGLGMGRARPAPAVAFYLFTPLSENMVDVYPLVSILFHTMDNVWSIAAIDKITLYAVPFFFCCNCSPPHIVQAGCALFEYVTGRQRRRWYLGIFHARRVWTKSTPHLQWRMSWQLRHSSARLYAFTLPNDILYNEGLYCTAMYREK